MLSWRWLGEHLNSLRGGADPVIDEALDVIAHDAALVGAKLHRALEGRDRHRRGEDEVEDGDIDPVQNDWNGSAKVALISLERSEAAWQVIIHTAADDTSVALADAAASVRRLAMDEFPCAMSFIRPGFDEPER
jgi:hypothetical protein